MTLASQMWQRLDGVHAVTYFSQVARDAFASAGLRGFWMGYFAGRAAPLGPVGPDVVFATFYNFPRWRVARAIPDAWTFASPETVLATRWSGAAAALRAAAPQVDDVAAQVNPALRLTRQAMPVEGRPLAAANLALPVPDDPVAELWQLATTLREHRGDGHASLLTAEGLSGCEVHVITAAYRDVPKAFLQAARGWTDDEWAHAQQSLQARGVVGADGSLTPEGRRWRDELERRTDELATAPYAAIADRADDLLALLTPLRDALADAGALIFPNPIGLPR